MNFKYKKSKLISTLGLIYLLIGILIIICYIRLGLNRTILLLNLHIGAVVLILLSISSFALSINLLFRHKTTYIKINDKEIKIKTLLWKYKTFNLDYLYDMKTIGDIIYLAFISGEIKIYLDSLEEKDVVIFINRICSL